MGGRSLVDAGRTAGREDTRVEVKYEEMYHAGNNPFKQVRLQSYVMYSYIIITIYFRSFSNHTYDLLYI